MSDTEPTAAEIARDIHRVSSQLSELRLEMREQFAALDKTYMRQDVLNAMLTQIATRLEGQDARQAKTEGWIVWAQRAVLGAVIAGVMATLLLRTGHSL